MPLPTFIVIGAMKSGTTSLNKYFKHHPQICMSQKKEINFFCNDNVWKHGVDWYSGNFEKSPDTIAFGDVSPNYSKCHTSPLAPVRMHETVPNARLIYIVRNPVKRFISHYIHNFAKMQTSKSFSEYLNDEIENKGNALRTSLYWEQLQRYLDYFPADNFKIIKSEELLNNRRETLSDIFDFIGVENHWDDAYNEESNVGSLKVRPRWIVSWTRRHPRLFDRIWKRRNGKLRGLLFRAFSRPDPSEDQLKQLTAVFKPDSEKLSDFCDIDFSDWYR